MLTIRKIKVHEDNYNLQFFKAFFRCRNYGSTSICKYSLVQYCDINWQSRSQTSWLKCLS